MNKIERINAELKKQISFVIADEIHDPRVTGFVSVVKVDTTQDMSLARVYVSFLNAEDPKESILGLQSAASFVRNCLKTRMKIRVIPEIRFILDESIEYGIKISDLMKNMNNEI